MQECSTTSGAAGSAGGQQPLLGLSSSCEKNERAAQGQQAVPAAAASSISAADAVDAVAGAGTPAAPHQQQPSNSQQALQPPSAAAATPAGEQEPSVPEPKRQICFDFTKNQCSRGMACKFSHNVDLIIRVNSQEKGICFDFLKGLCTRGPLCRFSHDLCNLQTQQLTIMSNKKRFAPICYDFVKNQCTRGEDCKYSHDYSSILFGPRAPGKDPYVICVDFTRGKCSRGTSCRYSHVDPRMLTAPLGPSSSIDPALIAAGLGTGALGSQAAMSAGTIPAIGAAQAATQAADLQAQAALMLSSLAPLTNGADSMVPWAVGGGLQQTPDYAALLEQMQRANLAEVLAPQLATAATTDVVASMAALSALLRGGMAPAAYGAGVAAEEATVLPSLAPFLPVQAPPCGDLYSQTSAASTIAATSLSAAPTPSTASATSTPFHQHDSSLPVPAPAHVATKAGAASVFPGLLGKGGAAGLLSTSQGTDSPTIAAGWGNSNSRQHLSDGLRQSLLASQAGQHAGGGNFATDQAGSMLPAAYNQLLDPHFNSNNNTTTYPGGLTSIWGGQ